MFFSFAVRSVYIESSSMFVRGGVYVVVRDAMGSFVARFSVSSLIFDYILTGPISVVSAGQYLARLLNEISEMMGAPGASIPSSSLSTLASRSPPTSGGATSRAFTNRAERRCGSCRSPA